MFNDPLTDTFTDALALRRVKVILPSQLSSRDWSGLDAYLKEQASFSANIDKYEILQAFDTLTDSILNPHTALRPDGTPFTEGFSFSSARAELKLFSKAIGYTGPGQAESERTDAEQQDYWANRIAIKLRTDIDVARGYGHALQSNSPEELDIFPCQELVRFAKRKEPRDWPARWRIAANHSGDHDALNCLDTHGVMAARTDSPIWAALGDSSLFPDALGNPTPPYAFGSGEGRLGVKRKRAVELGLIKQGDRVQPQDLPFPSRFAHPDIKSPGLREQLIAALGPGYEFTPDGLLKHVD